MIISKVLLYHQSRKSMLQLEHCSTVLNETQWVERISNFYSYCFSKNYKLIIYSNGIISSISYTL